MGLDMYFHAKRYLSDWNPDDKEIQSKITEVAKGFNDEWKPNEVTYKVGYWRKANAIHNWFVQNVQDGEDDCKEYYVGTESIRDLYDTVVECLDGGKDVALEKLPPADGFFFGGTTIDEYYWQDLEYTKRVLEPLVKAFDQSKELGDESYKHPIYQYTFHYCSSW